jgi:hypothetical protein
MIIPETKWTTMTSTVRTPAIDPVAAIGGLDTAAGADCRPAMIATADSPARDRQLEYRTRMRKWWSALRWVAQLAGRCQTRRSVTSRSDTS